MQPVVQRLVDTVEAGVLDEPIGFMPDPDELSFERGSIVRETRDDDGGAIPDSMQDPDQIGFRGPCPGAAGNRNDLCATRHAVPRNACAGPPEVDNRAAHRAGRDGRGAPAGGAQACGSVDGGGLPPIDPLSRAPGR